LGANHVGDRLLDENVAERLIGREVVEEGALGEFELLEDPVNARSLKAARIHFFEAGRPKPVSCDVVRTVAEISTLFMIRPA
jgi:hypothetical protein